MTDDHGTDVPIQGLIDRSESAWVAFYRGYYSRLYDFTFKILRDEYYAQNITTDAFLKVYENVSRFGDTHTINNVVAYLYVIARNSCFNHLKMDRRRLQRENRYAYQAMMDEDLHLIQAEGEILSELSTVYHSLPEHYRATIQLIYGQGFTYQEAASTLGVSVNSIKNYKTAALSKLKEFATQKNLSTTLLVLLILHVSVFSLS